jgi:hypothetical protein
MRRADRELRAADRERVNIFVGSGLLLAAFFINETWKRLAGLNHAHEKAVEVQHTYVPRSQHQSDIESVEQKVDTLRDDSIGQHGRTEGVASVGRLVVAAVGLLGVVLTIVVLLANHTF